MKTKRILSATLAAAMLLCCCALTAFAESETYIGYYNGYSYTCTAVCRTDTCKANMATESSEAMSIIGIVAYTNKYGHSVTGKISCNGAKRIVTSDITNVRSFESLNATFKVGSHVLQTIFVSSKHGDNQ